jgi:hypothetical protein
MRHLTRLFAAAAAGVLTAGLASAQIPVVSGHDTFAFTPPNIAGLGSVPFTGYNFGSTTPGASAFPQMRHDHNWQPMHGRPSVAYSGAFRLPTGSGIPNLPNTGDALVWCHGIDTTQGGANQSRGHTDITWFRLVQAWAPQQPFPGINTGLISHRAATASALSWDQCVEPTVHLPDAVNSGGTVQGVAAFGLRIPGTGLAPFPVYWELDFTWGPTAVVVPNAIGDASFDRGLKALNIPAEKSSNPLLANVIFEVQGPINGGAFGFPGMSYYMASTIEWEGIGDPTSAPVHSTSLALPWDFTGYTGTGGVTNGNGNWAYYFTKAHVGSTSWVGHSRFFSQQVFIIPNPSPPPPNMVFIFGQFGASFRLATPGLQSGAAANYNFRGGRWEDVGTFATETPFLWGKSGMKAAGQTLGTGSVLPDGPGILGQLLGSRWGQINGGGGPDWRISGPPVGTVDVQMHDHASGASNNGNIYAKITSAPYATSFGGMAWMTTPPTPTFGSAPPGPPAYYFQTTGMGAPCIGGALATFNRATLLWAFSACAPMLQNPGSWDTFLGPGVSGGGAVGTPVAGSETIGTGQTTAREGPQRVPIIADFLTGIIVNDAFLTFGGAYSASDDPFTDGYIDGSTTGTPSPPFLIGFSSLFDGTFRFGRIANQTSGISEIGADGGFFPLLPDSTLAGFRLFVAGDSSHFTFCPGPGLTYVRDEVGNALTIVLQ